MAYSASHIKVNRLETHPVTVRCELRYTLDALTWALSRRIGGKEIRHKFNLPVKALPKFWQSGRAKHMDPRAGEINALIDKCSVQARLLHAQFLEKKAFPSKEEFAIAILGADQAVAKNSFFQDYQAYIDFLANRKVSSVFISSQNLILRVMRDFQAATGYRLEYARINKTFGAKFISWCESNLPKRRPNQDLNRTARKYLDDFKIFLSHALSEGWTKETGFKQIKITFSRDAFPFTHTDQEIEAMMAVTADDLKAMTPEKRDRALISRDWYVMATQTSMRYVDWKTRRMNIIPVKQGWNIQYIQQKTDGPLEIPVSKIALQILSKHNFKMPNGFGPMATLNHVRAVAKAAGITKKIGTHTARRTFCTIQERAGVPRSVIMRITGHQTEKDYLRYVGITFEFNADMMRRANPDMYDLKKHA